MRRMLTTIATMLLAGCATAGEPGPPPWAPVGGVSQVVIDGQTLHYANLLGLPRERIERGLPPGRSKAGPRWAGWVEYGEELEIEYRDGVAVRLRARVPMTIASDCFEAAGWMGFPQPRMPLIDGPRCLWSGPRVNNQLEKGYGGELNREVRWFMVWLIAPSSPVASRRETRPPSLVAPATCTSPVALRCSDMPASKDQRCPRRRFTMARNPLQVQLVVDRVRCHDEGDGLGSAEPYLWTVFFKVDGDTVALGDDLFLHGHATVIPTPGSHGNLGDDDVDEGEDVLVPSAIGELVATLRPIPVPSWVTETFGVEDVGGVIGVVTVLMEEDNVSHAGAEAGHTALDAFVRQAIDGLVPTLGVVHADVTEEDIVALTLGAEAAIAEAVESAQTSWENFVSWLNADDQIGNAVFTFSHDSLAEKGSQPFAVRWESEGDWELVGRATATPTCPAEAVLRLLLGMGLLSPDVQRHSLAVIRDFRRTSFAGNRELGGWWMLAQRNTASMTQVLVDDPALARRLVVPLMAELASAAIDPDAPIPEAALVALEGVLQAFVERGNRRLRIDAKAALGVLPKLYGASLRTASALLVDEPPTRKPLRMGGLRPLPFRSLRWPQA
jgi:hypothetical protein